MQYQSTVLVLEYIQVHLLGELKLILETATLRYSKIIALEPKYSYTVEILNEYTQVL